MSVQNAASEEAEATSAPEVGTASPFGATLAAGGEYAHGADETSSASKQRKRAPLRFGFWMELWAGLYAGASVYPRPELTALAVAVVTVAASCIYLYRPAGWSA